jgi:hypothetical protein
VLASRSRSLLLPLVMCMAALPQCPAAMYTYVAVGDPTQVGGYAYALDNSGKVATTSLVTSYVATDLIYGTFFPISIPGSASSTPGVVAQGMNDLGDVVGRYRIAGNPANQTSGFLRRENGVIETFTHPTHLSLSISDINNHGDMVGETRSDFSVFGMIRGFSYSSGVYSEISFPGSVLTRAYGINDAGAIVGQFQNADAVNRPFVFSGGVYQELAPVSPLGGLQSALATGISDTGLIIGSYRDASNVSRTWIRNSNGSYLYPELPGAGWSINDVGQVSGSFLNPAKGGLRSGFVATPIPEPVTVASLAMGMLAAAAGSRSRGYKRQDNDQANGSNSGDSRHE